MTAGDVTPQARIDDRSWIERVLAGCASGSLKVDNSNRTQYGRAASAAFMPFPDTPSMTMPYYNVPLRVLERADDLTEWAKMSITVAKNKKATKVVAPEPTSGAREATTDSSRRATASGQGALRRIRPGKT